MTQNVAFAPTPRVFARNEYKNHTSRPSHGVPIPLQTRRPSPRYTRERVIEELETNNAEEKQMGIDYQLYRVWANTSKGVRQCQKADKALQEDNADSATNHLEKALNYFGYAAEHMAKAEDDAVVKAGKLLDAGNGQLQKALDLYAEGHTDRAQNHYDEALEKYDEAFDLID